MRANKHTLLVSALSITLFLSATFAGRTAAQGLPSLPGPFQSSLFGPNVYIFSPTSPNIQSTILNIYATQGKKANEFIQNRYALLFKPGAYNLDVRVGYYTQVAGLGLSPDGVTITGAVRTQDNPATNPINAGPGALDNFWRSMENLSIIPTLGSLTVGPPPNSPPPAPPVPFNVPLNQNVWAVSQAAPLRRIHIKQSPITLTANECARAIAFLPAYKQANSLIAQCPTTLRLFDLGWSSGGFMADTMVDGLVEIGSQQQWFARNSTWQQWNDENWNMVFLGSVPVPAGTWPGVPGVSDGAITSGGPTPIVREKPFLYIDKFGSYWVMVPALKYNTNSVDWNGSTPPGTQIAISNFYIVKAARAGQPTTLSAVTVGLINIALRLGYHLLFTPGVYYVNGTINVTRPNTVILGMGSATLVANNGKPIIAASDVDGLTIAGLTFDAGPINTNTLVQMGPAGSAANHSKNPSFLFDVFCRVGGAPQYSGQTSACLTINSNNVIGDNLWLWRADHGSNVGWTVNPADSGLIVNGNNVSMYGLAVEHFQQFQTVWNGEGGRDYFYQSEMPYDIPTQADWNSAPGTLGYASYKVADNVTDHAAWGLGVYCFFRDAVITADTAIEAPPALAPYFTDMVTFWLDGMAGSQITHIFNDEGGTVTISNRKETLPP